MRSLNFFTAPYAYAPFVVNTNRTDRSEGSKGELSEVATKGVSRVAAEGVDPHAASTSLEQQRVERLTEKLARAIDRNANKLAAFRAVRTELRGEHAKAVDGETRAALAWEIEEVEERISFYKARGDAIERSRSLIEQGRLDLAEKFIDEMTARDSMQMAVGVRRHRTTR